MSKSSPSPKLTWVDHLEELRKRIIYVLIVLTVSLVIGFVAAQPLIILLKNVSPAADITWNVFSPWDSLRIYVNVAFAIAIIISLPFALYQLWLFVKPGLREEEQRASLLYIPFAFLLSVGGIAFGYFVVFPFAMKFTTLLTKNLGLVQTYGIVQYFSFMFNILIPLAVLFELPIVIMFLTKIRLLNPQRLRKFRRYAYFILLLIGALITPPDVISALIVTLPMIILYEISVLLSGMVHRKQLARDAAREAQFTRG